MIYIQAIAINGMADELRKISQADFEGRRHLTRVMQQLLIIMRINGEIKRMNMLTSFKSSQFDVAIKALSDAGWIEKKLKYNDDNRPSTTYMLSRDGNDFVRKLAKFPGYHDFYEMFRNTISIG